MFDTDIHTHHNINYDQMTRKKVELKRTNKKIEQTK